jgi:hypothetical protein
MYRSHIDFAIADLLQNSTQDIVLYERSTHAPFSGCSDFIAGVRNLDSNTKEAAQCFARCAADTSKNPEVRLAAHCNSIRLAQARGEPTLPLVRKAYQFVRLQRSPSAQSQNLVEEIYIAKMRDWASLSAGERRYVDVRLPAHAAGGVLSCSDFVAGIRNVDSDKDEAAQCFTRSAENKSNSPEVRLAAHCKLIELAQEQGRPTLALVTQAYRLTKELTQPDSQSRNLVAETCAAMMRQWDSLFPGDRLDIIRRAPELVATNEMFLGASYPFFRSTILRELEKPAHADAKREMLDALVGASESESAGNRFEPAGFAKAAWRDMQAAEWTRTRSPADLDGLLQDMAENSSRYERPTLPLRYFHLFERTEDPAMKCRIAQAAVAQKDLFSQRADSFGSEMIAHFAYANLYAFHIESGSPGEPALSFLQIAQHLDRIVDVTTSEISNPRSVSHPDAYAASDLATEAISLRAHILGDGFVARIKDGRSEADQTEVDGWVLSMREFQKSNASLLLAKAKAAGDHPDLMRLAEQARQSLEPWQI